MSTINERGRPRRIEETATDETPRGIPVRGDLRAESPREAAERRAAEIMGNSNGDIGDATDRFYIDPTSVPDGWSYEWKVLKVMGEYNSSKETQLKRTGWEFVPASRHPEMMGSAQKDASIIERDGVYLMERPMSITEMVKRKEANDARNNVVSKTGQLNGVGDAFEARQATKNRSYEPMQIPS